MLLSMFPGITPFTARMAFQSSVNPPFSAAYPSPPDRHIGIKARRYSHHITIKGKEGIFNPHQIVTLIHPRHSEFHLSIEGWRSLHRSRPKFQIDIDDRYFLRLGLDPFCCNGHDVRSTYPRSCWPRHDVMAGAQVQRSALPAELYRRFRHRCILSFWLFSVNFV